MNASGENQSEVGGIAEESLSQPVAIERPPEGEPEVGVALCLSGGGYRAMLFHLGAIWRLNEAGYLPRLKRVSSVSGGSITAGALGMVWSELTFSSEGVATNLSEALVSPIRQLASKTVDFWSILSGLFTPGTVNSKVVARYDKHLFNGATLQNLPADQDGPRFVINATNLQTGVLWRFSRPYMADYKTGRVMAPDVSLATAVGASSAFPPILSPTTLEVDPASYDQESSRWPLATMQGLGKVSLSDGGVYDNLGLETAWKRYRTILISDGGGVLAPQPKVKSDWARHSIRVLTVIDGQVRSLRKRQAIGAFQRGDRHGTYWGIRSDPADYALADPLPTDHSKIRALGAIPTRLRRMGPREQESLINWGYAICDTAMRRWVDPELSRPVGLPYPGTPID